MQIKELYSHTTNDITIYVEIDYPNNKISLIEPTGNQGVFREKKWIFAGRGKEYMSGWRNILEAMTAAVTDAERKLSMYAADRIKEKEEMLVKLAQTE